MDLRVLQIGAELDARDEVQGRVTPGSVQGFRHTFSGVVVSNGGVFDSTPGEEIDQLGGGEAPVGGGGVEVEVDGGHG
jgi:hypothetical protein